MTETAAQFQTQHGSEVFNIYEAAQKGNHYLQLLIKHKVNMVGGSRNKSYKKLTTKQAESEADSLKLSGWLRWLFIAEAKSGNVTGSNLENVTEQGLLDELITPLSLGLIHGPGAGKTNIKTSFDKEGVPQTKAENVPGIGEKTSEALDWIGKLLSGEGIRLLEIIGGALLVLFGLYTLVKGDTPHPVKVAKGLI